jgi:hypothetical protein
MVPIHANGCFLCRQLGRGRIRQTWLLCRRIIALAELTGLPRASMAVGSTQDTSSEALRGDKLSFSSAHVEELKKKANIWESICAIDRITSTMW